MIKDNDLVGAIAIYRKEVNPFAEKQIELLSNFAAQAVIAIENARLLNELRGSLEQQTATSDVLRIIAGSPGELDAVFKTMLKNARHICDAKIRHPDATRSGWIPQRCNRRCAGCLYCGDAGKSLHSSASR
jgi:hypothetical protein